MSPCVTSIQWLWFHPMLLELHLGVKDQEIIMVIFSLLLYDQFIAFFVIKLKVWNPQLGSYLCFSDNAAAFVLYFDLY